MSDASLPLANSSRTRRLRTLGKRLLAVFISYEVLTYALATVQAVGLSLPTMVTANGAASAAECDDRIQAVADTVAGFRRDHPDSQMTYTSHGVEALIQSMPRCPAGGHYEVMPPGTVLKTERGTNFVVTRDRVVVRCVHDDGTAFHRGIGMTFCGH